MDDFVQSVSDAEPTFYGYWTHHLENTDVYPTLSEIVDKFRKHLRKNTGLKGGSHGIFAASFRGEELHSNTDKLDDKKTS